ncbi:hypothetical protein AB0F91_06570 [Amycolatopsis sp. NPDC023774]|uniref:hypothetical protein n=1 Tax=Amycolatopsis sp. NPDC023774 TaxID=3155015 RepID=UPI0033E1EF69
MTSALFPLPQPGGSPTPCLYSPARNDAVRRTADGRRLARWWAASDQAPINAHNRSSFG